MENLSNISIIPLLFFSFHVSSLHAPAHTGLNFLCSPSGASVVLDQLQLTTSQVGLRDVSEHGGATSLQPIAPTLQSQALLRPLSQAGQGDTWPNRRNTSSCRLPDAHCGEKPGQRWRRRTSAPPYTFPWTLWCLFQSQHHTFGGTGLLEKVPRVNSSNFKLSKCLHCVTIKVFFLLIIEKKAVVKCAPQSESGWKKVADRTTAPFSLQPVDMKEHIMSEIRGNYTGSAL